MIHDTHPGWLQMLPSAAAARAAAPSRDDRAIRGLIFAGAISTVAWGLALLVIL